ncbi:hypothetical protein EUGRSUZ_H00028 [Eucalyptus grandis]|uniref:Uncharacterized protein n=2 Tax=Eucalyptus grandis TaxID=71139 RepID=A0A059AU60_EUCGR|nr:hypothetical protein EUGRSUZ_H00028 [Eucalyptus grandis]
MNFSFSIRAIPTSISTEMNSFLISKRITREINISLTMLGKKSLLQIKEKENLKNSARLQYDETYKCLNCWPCDAKCSVQ